MDRLKRTIVGLDPGTTTGIAFVSLKGKVLKTYSERHFPTDRIIESIMEEGKPVVIATDKEKVPSLVEEMGANLDAKVFSPGDDLSVEKKRKLAENVETESPHERDAVASALYAYHDYENKFRNIERKMDDLNLTKLTPEIKDLVVRDEVENISEAVERVLGGGEEDVSEEEGKSRESVTEEELREKLDNLRDAVVRERKDRERMEDYVESLEERVENLKMEKEGLERDVEDLKEGRKDEVIAREKTEEWERKLRSKRNEAKRLKKEKRELSRKARKLEEFEEMRKDGKVPVREIEDMGRESVEEEGNFLSLEGGILHFDEVSENERVLDMLSEKDVKGIVGDFSQDFRDLAVSRGLIVISDREMEGDDGVSFVNEEVVERAEKADKKSFLEWIKRYRRRENER